MHHLGQHYSSLTLVHHTRESSTLKYFWVLFVLADVSDLGAHSLFLFFFFFYHHYYYYHFSFITNAWLFWDVVLFLYFLMTVSMKFFRITAQSLFWEKERKRKKTNAKVVMFPNLLSCSGSVWNVVLFGRIGRKLTRHIVLTLAGGVSVSFPGADCVKGSMTSIGLH